MENYLDEYAKVSIVRFSALIEAKHQVEMQKRELELYCERLEQMIMRGYKSDSYYVHLDREEVEQALQLEGVKNEV